MRLANVSMTTMRTTIAHGGDRVAVIGLGLIGNLAAQVFHACGMQVNAVDLSPACREIAARCGIRAVYGPRTSPTWRAPGWSSRRPARRRRRWRARSAGPERRRDRHDRRTLGRRPERRAVLRSPATFFAS